MNIEDLNKALGEVWESSSVKPEEQKEETKKPKKEKKTLFLGERSVYPVGQVVFQNGIFFVERTGGTSFSIKPKTVKEYLELKPKKHSIRITKGATRIVIPMVMTGENPMLWFKEKHVDNIKKRNTQSKFIREIWRHRNEVFKEMMMG